MYFHFLQFWNFKQNRIGNAVGDDQIQMSSEQDIKLAMMNPKLFKIVKDPVQKRFQFTLDDAIMASNEIFDEPWISEDKSKKAIGNTE